MANDQLAPTDAPQSTVAEDVTLKDTGSASDAAGVAPEVPEPNPKPNNSESDKPKESDKGAESGSKHPAKEIRGLSLGLSRLVPSFELPKLPKLPNLPKLKLKLPSWRASLVPLLLLFMAVGYVVVSRQFILLIYKKRTLAMSGITISLVLPLANACAEYSLMRWGYLISGVLIIGGLIVITKSPTDWILIALVTWFGLLGMVISGEILTSQKIKIWLVVMLQTLIALAATGLGWFLVWLMS
ncbi:MAG: hypothetical protein ACK456_01150 [Pseudanabaenaceae cyanobacterium]|jgi:hypothetical protein